MDEEKLILAMIAMQHTDNVSRRILVSVDPLRWENDSEHANGMCQILMLLRPYIDPENELDWAQVYELAILHDIPEIITGDTWYLGDKSNKRENEKVAVSKLWKDFEHLRLLWKNVADRATPEAVLVKKIDILQAVIKIVSTECLTYKNNEVTMNQEFEFSEWVWNEEDIVGYILRCAFNHLSPEDFDSLPSPIKAPNNNQVLLHNSLSRAMAVNYLQNDSASVRQYNPRLHCHVRGNCFLCGCETQWMDPTYDVYICESDCRK